MPVELRRPDQFELADPVEASLDTVLDPEWSLYCLDIEEDRAMFVELPAGFDLARAPFAYAAQFENAIRAAFVPLDELPSLAKEVPQTANVALLMSTGRCGSTLASRIFAQIPGVWSLSEPDWFGNLTFARFDLDPAKTLSLIEACTRLTCRPPVGANVNTIVLKPRSEMIIQASSYIEALPDARAVFMYRDCFGYVNSIYKFVQRIQINFAQDPDFKEAARRFTTMNGPASILDDYFDSDEDLQIIDYMTLGWALRVKAYLGASANGMKVAPLHYADLTNDRHAQTKLLLESCGIDQCHVDVALRGFEKDAHSGSVGENAVPAEPITDAQRHRISELVARWGMPDFVNDRLPPI